MFFGPVSGGLCSIEDFLSRVDEFKALSPEKIRAFGKDNNVIYDIKYLLKANETDGRL